MQFEKWLKSLLKGFLVMFDARVLVLLVPALLYLYWLDAAQANTIVYSFVVTIAVAGVSHFTRKVFFPYVDMEKVASTAIKEPLGAALVFLAIAIVLCVMLFVTMQWVRT